MFFYKFKNIDFEDNGVLVDFEPAYFPLMVRDSDDALPFRAKDFFILLNDISGIFGFIHFLGSFVLVFCFNCVVAHERNYQLLFHFFFVNSLRLLDVFKTFPPLSIKNNQYTRNLKHPLQTKIQLY